VVQTGGPWDSNSIRIAVSSYNTVREKFPQRSFWLRANGDKGSACGRRVAASQGSLAEFVPAPSNQSEGNCIERGTIF
jgi:hypothetical protein